MRYVALLAMGVYIAFFAVGMGPVPWAVNAEIFPLRLRATANSLATITNWTVNLVVSMSFLSLSEAITAAGAFTLVAGFAVLTTIFVYFRLPETAGLQLEEILILLSPRPNHESEIRSLLD